MPTINTNTAPPSPCVAEALESLGKFADLLTQTACEGFPDAIYRAALAHYAALARILEWHSTCTASRSGTVSAPRPDDEIAYAVPLLLAEIDNTDNIICMLRARQQRAYSVLAWLQNQSRCVDDPPYQNDVPEPATAANP